MLIKPTPDSRITDKESLSLLMLAKQSACGTDALKNYLEWEWQNLAAQTINAQDVQIYRIQGAMSSVQKQYAILFGSEQQLNATALTRKA